MTFYLKYRPQSLNELIGQEQVKKILTGAFENNKLSHAYLFVGPRGTGKTSTARILAKMVNCERKGESVKGKVPCNECQTCIAITDGSNLDLIEIDAASNRGIDDIRALRDRIKLAPSSSKKKVYIIDEVHMLTSEAFNALLKTLEEPPEHALFILATTEVQKVPQTIMSRVQRLDFKLASQSELTQALERIASEEKIDIEPDGLKQIVKNAEGSFRDGVKLLDQITSGGGKITKQIVEESLKSGKFEDLASLIEYIALSDTKSSLKIVIDQVDKGLDVKDFMLSLMDMFRNLVFIKNGLGEGLVLPHFPEDKYKILIDLAEKYTNTRLVVILDILQKALEKLKFSSIQSLPLEIAILEMCEWEGQMKSDEIRKSENQKISQSLNQKEIVVSDTLTHRQTGTPILSDLSGVQISSDLSGSSDILKLKEKWTFVLETVRQYNFSLEALLRQVSVKECTNTSVIMEVPYAFHQRILESPKNRELVESLLIDILGRNVRISTILSQRSKSVDDIANVNVAADDDIIRAAAEIFNSDVN